MPWSDWTSDTSRGWSRASRNQFRGYRRRGRSKINNQPTNELLAFAADHTSISEDLETLLEQNPDSWIAAKKRDSPRNCRGYASSLRKPAIKGTRVPVDVALPKLAGGMTAEEIANEYAIRGRYTCLFGLRSRDSWRRTGPGYAVNGQDPGGQELSRLELLGREECCAIR